MTDLRTLLRTAFQMLSWAERARIADAVSAGDSARDRNAWSEAVVAYRRALRLAPDLAHIWVQYGHALKESGSIADAEMAYRRSLELQPLVADTHLQLGHALKIRGLKEEATESYLRAIELDSRLEAAQDELAALGLSRRMVRHRIGRPTASIAGRPKHLIFVRETAVDNLPVEMQALWSEVLTSADRSAGVVRFMEEELVWLDDRTGKAALFETGDVIVSVGHPSAHLLRAIRLLKRRQHISYVPLLAKLTDANSEREERPIRSASGRLADLIGHSSAIMAPYAATAQRLKQALGAVGRSDLAVVHVALNTVLPALDSDMTSDDKATLMRLEGDKRIALLDLRNTSEERIQVIAEVWRSVVDRAGGEKAFRLVAIGTDAEFARAIPNADYVVNPSQSLVSSIFDRTDWALIPQSTGGWSSIVLLALSKGALPVVGPEATLVEVAPGLVDVCATLSAPELVDRFSRLIADRNYLRDRREVIANRTVSRSVAVVLAEFKESIFDAVQDFDPSKGRVTAGGYAVISLQVPYALGNDDLTLNGLAFARGNALLGAGRWEEGTGFGVSLLEGSAEISFVYLGDAFEPIEVHLLATVGEGTSLRISSPQARDGQTDYVSEATRWLSLSLSPDADSGLVVIGLDCQGPAGNIKCSVHVAYAEVSSTSRYGTRFLEAIGHAALFSR